MTRRNNHNRHNTKTKPFTEYISGRKYLTEGYEATRCIHGHMLDTRCWLCEPGNTVTPLQKNLNAGKCTHGKGVNEHCNVCDTKEPVTYGSDNHGAYGNYSTYRKCDHWQVKFPMLDGLEVLLSAYADRPWGQEQAKRDRTVKPDMGFYLADSWAGQEMLVSPGMRVLWASENKGAKEKVIYPWTDYSIPEDMEEFARGVLWLLRKIQNGKVVDIGCIGAHGRTGTMLACLLVAQGLPAMDAIRMVRNLHCQNAIETITQSQFVAALAKHINGEETEAIAPSLLDPINAPVKDVTKTVAVVSNSWKDMPRCEHGYTFHSTEGCHFDGTKQKQQQPAFDVETYGEQAAKWWEEDEDIDNLVVELADEFGMPEADIWEVFTYDELSDIIDQRAKAKKDEVECSHGNCLLSDGSCESDGQCFDRVRNEYTDDKAQVHSTLDSLLW